MVSRLCRSDGFVTRAAFALCEIIATDNYLRTHDTRSGGVRVDATRPGFVSCRKEGGLRCENVRDWFVVVEVLAHREAGDRAASVY